VVSIHSSDATEFRVEQSKFFLLVPTVLHDEMGDRINMSHSYSEALPSTPPNTPLLNNKPTVFNTDSVVELMSHHRDELVVNAPSSDSFSLVEKTYAKNEVSTLYGDESDRVNDATVGDDLNNRNCASNLPEKAKRDADAFAKSKSENYPLGRARKLLLWKSRRHSFQPDGSERTGQTDPVDDSLQSENNYFVDSQQRASLEAQANAPSPEAPRRMTTPVFYTSSRCLCPPRSRSVPSIKNPLRSCLKQADLSPRSSFSSQSSVHFGTINIREYDRRLSDNPAVTEGPPIGLGWGYSRQETEVKVDDYENLHPQRRVKEEFLMPARVREEMLICEWGHTMRDVRQASAESKEIRVHREKTLRTSKVSEKLTEALEASKRKFRRLKTGTTKEMEQEKLWYDASKWLDTDCDENSTYS
jgi:hypothetical protein